MCLPCDDGGGRPGDLVTCDDVRWADGRHTGGGVPNRL